jgi:hypothetical protein
MFDQAIKLEGERTAFQPLYFRAVNDIRQGNANQSIADLEKAAKAIGEVIAQQPVPQMINSVEVPSVAGDNR